jgi:hypothetical protein
MYPADYFPPEYFIETYFPSGNLVDEFTVTNGTVFTIVKQVNRFVLIPIGTIPIGTHCFPDQYINGYFAVPRELVQWGGSVEPLVVVAECA